MRLDHAGRQLPVVYFDRDLRLNAADREDLTAIIRRSVRKDRKHAGSYRRTIKSFRDHTIYLYVVHRDWINVVMFRCNKHDGPFTDKLDHSRC